MTRAALAVTLCLLAPAVLADDANARAEREARAWLKLCHEADAQRQQLCLTDQRMFIFEYVSAKAGNLLSMGGTSASFRPSDSPASTAGTDRLGLPQDLIQSCAWQAVRVQSTRGAAVAEHAVLREICRALSPNEITAADERAAQLLSEFRTAPAHEPPDDWEPRVVGQAPR